MGRNTQKRVVLNSTQGRPRISPLWLALAAGCLLTFAIQPITRRLAHDVPPLTVNRFSIDGAPVTLSQAAELRDEQLERFDLAQFNLLAAQGLPGCEGNTDEKLLAQLDDWAQRVRIETRRNEHRFQEHPEDYERSEAFYRMGMLVTVLQQDFGVRYNPDLIEPSLNPKPETDAKFVADAGNLFLTGLLNKRIGTCASMPVLYVAVGRRLGYPVHLVAVKDHLFARWEDDKERRNIEGTNQGIVCHTDEHYIQWRKVTDAELKAGWMMRKLSAREELADFIATRAAVLYFHGRKDEGLVAYAQAHRLWPGNGELKRRLAVAVAEAAPEFFRPVSDPALDRALRQHSRFDTFRELRTLDRLSRP